MDVFHTLSHRRLLTLFIISAMVGYLPGADGDDGIPEFELEPLTVTAERPYIEPTDLPAQVSVITAEEIEASGVRTVAEIVASSLGVGLEQYGNLTQPGLVSIRGSSAEQVLVLMDGVRLNTASGGGVDLNAIPLDAIERIEIIRGGGSALYGEGAFGGIINIVTMDGGKGTPETTARYSYGSFNTHRGGIGSRGGLGEGKVWGYSVDVDGYYTDGNYTYPDDYDEGGIGERVNADGYSLSTSGKLTWEGGGEGPRCTLSGRGNFRDVGVPGLLEFPSESARMADGNMYLSFRMDRIETPVGSFEIDASLSEQERHYTDPDWYLGSVDDTHLSRAADGGVTFSRRDVLGNLILSSSTGVSLGADRLDSTALVNDDGSTDAGTAMRSSLGGFINLSFLLFPTGDDRGRIVLTPAFRYDLADTQMEGDEDTEPLGQWSWGSGLLISLDDAGLWKVKGNIGSAYRLPDFSDLFWPATSFAVGNPDLLPETSLFWDAGITFKPFPFLELNAAWFDQWVENLIQWNPGPTGRWSPSNLGLAHIYGLEVEASVLVPFRGGDIFWETRGNYSYLRAIDRTENSATYDKQLVRRPMEKANLTTMVSHRDGHSISVTGRYVGFRYMTAMNTKTLPAYFLLDTSARITLGQWEISLTGLNLLDTPYIDLEEYPVPGREIQIEARITL